MQYLHTMCTVHCTIVAAVSSLIPVFATYTILKDNASEMIFCQEILQKDQNSETEPILLLISIFM